MAALVPAGEVSVTLGTDGILRVVHARDATVTVDIVRTIIAAHRELAKGRKLPVLVDASDVRTMDRDARQLSAGSEVAEVTSRLAILVGSALSAMVANFFLRVGRPRYETRVFASLAKAEDWLLQVAGSPRTDSPGTGP